MILYYIYNEMEIYIFYTFPHIQTKKENLKSSFPQPEAAFDLEFGLGSTF